MKEASGTRRKDKTKDKPDCYGCIHFYVTWDFSFPYGCKGFGMKSVRIPALAVYLASGTRCMLYTEKQGLLDRGRTRTGRGLTNPGGGQSLGRA